MKEPSPKWKVHENEHNAGVVPTIAVMLWLGWMGFLTYIILYAALFASTFQRKIITVILLTSLLLPPSFPGKIGRSIGNWIMKTAARYFGLKVIIENEAALKKIDEDGKSAIFAMEPHDVLPFTVMVFSPALGYLPGKMRKTGCALVTSAIFKLPIIRQVYYWVGCKPVDKKTFRKRLENTEMVGFVPGGVQEVTMIDPKKKDELILYLRSRKGFIKLALEKGVPIVPVFAFGLDKSYSYFIPRGNFIVKLARTIGFLPVVFTGRFGIPFFIPKAEQQTVVFGEPIDVPCEGDNIKPESVDKYHALYLKKLEELFDRHKDAEGYGHRKLKIL